MITVNKNYCPQNHPCPVVRRCPANAIVQKGFAAPTIDKSKCTNCNACTTMCSVFQKE